MKKRFTDAIEAALSSASASRNILNIASGKTRSVLEVIDAIETVTGHTFAREYVEARNTDVDVSSLDIARARTVLGWNPRTPLEKGIEQTVAAVRFRQVREQDTRLAAY